MLIVLGLLSCLKFGSSFPATTAYMLSFLLSRPLTMVLSLVYPAYRSFKALETPDREDDDQWLTYWIILGFFSFVEYFADVVFWIIPFYFEAKFLFVLWLQLPQTQGAKYMYLRYIKPFLSAHEHVIDAKIASIGGVAHGVAKQGLVFGSKWLSENASKALDAALKASATALVNQHSAAIASRLDSVATPKICDVPADTPLGTEQLTGASIAAGEKKDTRKSE
eukprot:ANDGO_03436.mRNA.1 Protein YOP1